MISPINKEFYFFGYKFEIRIESPEFRATMKRLERLIQDRNFTQFTKNIEKAYQRWGSDPALVEVDTLAGFISGDDEPTAKPQPIACDGDKPHRCPKCWSIPTCARQMGRVIAGHIYSCIGCNVAWMVPLEYKSNVPFI